MRSSNLARVMQLGQILLLLSLILSCSALGCSPQEDPADKKPRPLAPDFSLSMLGEETTVSLAALRGKIVILDFWATWCTPCEFQVPELNAFLDAHREEADLRVYGISVDTEGPAVVEKWVREKGVRYPILLSGDDLARSFGADGFPTLYVIGPDGKIDSTHIGMIAREDLEEAVSALRRR